MKSAIYHTWNLGLWAILVLIMVMLVRTPATLEQINQMAETYFGLRIKLAVDVAKENFAGGGKLHADKNKLY